MVKLFGLNWKNYWHRQCEFKSIRRYNNEILYCFQEKQIKIADVVWRNGVKNVNDLTFLFKLCDLCLKYDADKAITDGIKQEIWSKRDQQEIWPYIAAKELEVCYNFIHIIIFLNNIMIVRGTVSELSSYQLLVLPPILLAHI